MQQLYDFVWDRGFWQNVVVTILVGGPLSIYLAFLVNRLAAYRQAKLEASAEIMRLYEKMLLTENAMAGQILLRSVLEAPTLSLQADGQNEAAAELQKLRHRLRTYFGDEIVTETKKRGLLHTKLSGGDWIDAQNEIFRRSIGVIRDAVKRVGRLPMNIGPIIFLGYANVRMLRRSDCGDCCPTCNRTI